METQTYKYRDYEIVVTHTPPFFQAAIYPTNQSFPQIDWHLEPIRSINVKGAEDEAKARINAGLADLADAPKASRRSAQEAGKPAECAAKPRSGSAGASATGGQDPVKLPISRTGARR